MLLANVVKTYIVNYDVRSLNVRH